MKSPSPRTTIALTMLTALLVVSGCARKAVETPPAPTSSTPVPSTTPPAAPETPAPAAPAPSTPAPGDMSSALQPVYFDYDSDALREDGRAVLDRNARWLRENSTVTVTIEGHCDERGTAEYNQALGERRAQAAKDYLVQAGIADARLRVISYGKERPFSTGQDEASYQQNRRAHFTGS